MSTRRQFLAGGLGLLGIGATLAGCSAEQRQTAVLLRSNTSLPAPFVKPFTTPPVKRAVSTAGGIDRYEIVQRPGTIDVIPGRPTPIMGYDGIFPGPTIRTRGGRPTIVTHRNELRVPTVVHLHGGHTPADSDGYPIDFLLPAGLNPVQHKGIAGRVATGSRDYAYPGKQRAATLWYHDHRMDFSGPQVWAGLAGFHLIDDDEQDALPLPRGERDLPLLIADRSFGADGSFIYPARDPLLVGPPGVTDAYMSGVLGDVILVNGTPWPTHQVDRARYRLRLLNASNARRYDLVLDPPPPGAPFVQIGSDGGLLEHPLEQSSITISAGERFDVIVDFSGYPAGTEVTLSNTLGEAGTASVMRFVVGSNSDDDSSIPDRLSSIEPIPTNAATPMREWRFTRGSDIHGHPGWAINGKGFDPMTDLATPALGAVEIWRFATDVHHPVHVHLDQFQVIGRGGNGPGPMDHGWKDTVDLLPAETIDVAVRFTDYTGRFLLHCHNLEHEDMAMMAAFSTIG